MSNCDHDDHERDTPHLTRVERLWYIVNGNGDVREGLVYRVEKLEEIASDQRDLAKVQRENGWKLLTAVIGSALATIMTILFKVH